MCLRAKDGVQTQLLAELPCRSSRRTHGLQRSPSSPGARWARQHEVARVHLNLCDLRHVDVRIGVESASQLGAGLFLRFGSTSARGAGNIAQARRMVGKAVHCMTYVLLWCEGIAAAGFVARHASGSSSEAQQCQCHRPSNFRVNMLGTLTGALHAIGV